MEMPPSGDGGAPRGSVDLASPSPSDSQHRKLKSAESVPAVVIDSREQRPYSFDHSVVRGLPAGDYSLVGLEDRVAIERKSHADAYGSLGHARDRFEREVERLAALEYSAIVIEASLPAFLKPPAFSRLNPRAAIATLLSWSVRYRLPIFFAGDRTHAEALTRQLLARFAKERGGSR